jgi:ribonuclease G
MVTIEIARAGGRLYGGVLDRGILTDLFVDRADRPDAPGTVVLARVDRVFAGRAALEIGAGRSAILEGSTAELRPGDGILVQILRPSRDDKGPEVTRDIALPGIALVHRPLGQGLAVSSRLPPGAKRDWAARLAGRPGGWIVRSAAASLTPESVLADADRLETQGRTLRAPAARAPAVLDPGPGLAGRLILDHPAAERIEVAGRELHRAVRHWATKAAPSLAERIVPTDGSALPDAAAALLAPEVPLPSGGRITIEATRALTAIDVDSGAAAALASNLEAAAAIARHLRLRAIGGIVVVDFVSMARGTDRAAVIDALRSALVGDTARITLSDRLSPLGLAELARERRGPSLAEALVD